MKLQKFFEFWTHGGVYDPNVNLGEISDVFNIIEDEYDCSIEINEEGTHNFFLSKFKYWEKVPDIDKYEAVSKIIELKSGNLISPKFIESYISDYYNYNGTSQDTKDYHKQFSKSSRYLDDVNLIIKYGHSNTILVLITFDRDSDLTSYNFNPIFENLKSMYGLDVLYYRKNQRLPTGEILTTIMFV